MSSPSAQGVTDSGLFAQVIMLARGYATPACLHAAAKLKIADFLSGGPRPVSELARESQVNEDALYRVLRALASINVFRETAPRTFANTPISELLRSDVAGSARDAVLFMGDALHMRVYGELLHSVETGRTAFKKVTGTEPFEFFRQNTEENQLFNAAMTSISASSVPPALQAYDFGETGTLADIGCGHGALLAGILQKHRGLRGIAFDLPNVVEGAKQRIESLGLASRCEILGGSFFEAMPPADSYVMKSIIHDWDDTRAIAILRNCAKAMRGPDGKVILLEMIVGPANEPGIAKWIDIEMLTIAGGRERTETEYAQLFTQAGLRLARAVRSTSPFSVIEAVRA